MIVTLMVDFKSCLGWNFFDELGLRYDDLYDPYYDLDVKEALNRLPREIVDARNQRLKRAIDLSLKHKYLPEDLQVQILCINIFSKNNSFGYLIFNVSNLIYYISKFNFYVHLRNQTTLSISEA